MQDDLEIGAFTIQVGFTEDISRAVPAGNDHAMICYRIGMVRDAYDTLRRLPSKLLDPALSAIAEIKRHLAPPTTFSEEAFRSLDHQVWNLRVAVLGPELAKYRSPDDGKRSPVEVY